MNFKQIRCISDIDFELTWQTYSSSFPVYEKRLLNSHKEALADSRFFANSVYDKGKYIGFIFYWILDSYIFIEHFAIKENYRNMNYGSKIIGKLISENARFTLLLEIDPPEDEISRRRLSFYSRLGFKNNDQIIHRIPSFQKNLGSYNLNILSYGRTLSLDEYLLFYDSLMKSVFKYSEK